MAAGDLASGSCRFCSCTETKPCEGGCAWTDDTRSLCTTCLGAVAILIEMVKALSIVASSPKAGLHQAVGSWHGLPLEQQRILVKTMRYWLDGVEKQVVAELGERARDNGEELDAIAGFILERDPELLASSEMPLAGVVIKLLEPHIGNRIVTP